MSHRTNWKVLSTTDPIPGDAWAIRDSAQSYSKVATDIQNSENALSHIVTGQIDSAWVSQAVDEIRDDAKTVVTMLGKAQIRYSVAADALNDYATALDAAQTRADNDEGRAQSAAQARDQAETTLSQSQTAMNALLTDQRRMDNYSGDPSGAPSDTQILNNAHAITRCKNSINDAKNDVSNATATIADCWDDLQTAIKILEEAAETAAGKIIAEMNSDGLNETWWEKALIIIDDIMRLAADLIAGIITDVINMVTGAINDIIDGLIDMAKAMWDIAQGIAKGMVTGDWTGLENGLVEILAATSEFMDGLSTIVSIISLFVPGFEWIGPLLSLAAAGLDIAVQAVTGELTPVNLLGDGIGIVTSLIDLGGAEGTFAKDMAKIGPDGLAGTIAANAEDVGTWKDLAVDGVESAANTWLDAGSWPSPAQDLLTDIAPFANIQSMSDWANTPKGSTTPVTPSTSFGQSMFNISPISVSYNSFMVPSISGGFALGGFDVSTNVTVLPMNVDVHLKFEIGQN